MNEKAQAIRYMTETAGWKIVEGYMRSRIEAAKNQLMTCPIEDVPKHRAAANALNAVLVYIQQESTPEGSDADA